MNRRHFLSTISATVFGTVTTGTTTAKQTDTRPSVSESVLQETGWVHDGHPDLPPVENLPTDDDINWYLTAYHDAGLDQTIRRELGEPLGITLKPLLAVRVTNDGLLDWSNKSRMGETAEPSSSIDGDVEDVVEHHLEHHVNDGNFEIDAEYHVKGLADTAQYSVSQIPYVGDLISTGLDYLWDAETEITPATGGTSYLGQYLANYPIQESSVDPTVVEETHLDYRGWYADWFANGDFYAVSGFYPEDADHLAETLAEAFDSNIEIDPNVPFEDEVIRLLSNIQ